jgi:hypothetical protein
LSQLRSARWAAPVAATAAGACVLLNACSGGSLTPSANSANSSKTSSSPAAGSSASGGSGASASSSPASTASAPAAVSTAGLTGNFCTDFLHMSTALSKLPQPTNQGNLAADQADARRIITQVEASFNGLATEAPPNVAAAIHNITGQYQAVLGEMSSFGSLAQIKQQEGKFVSSPTYLASIRVLVQYMAKCG